MGASAGFAVRSEEKRLRKTRDVWFRLADINWRTNPQDAQSQGALSLRFIRRTFNFSSISLQPLMHAHIHIRARSRTDLWTHAHLCVRRAACSMRPKAPPDYKLENKAESQRVENTVIKVYSCCALVWKM